MLNKTCINCFYAAEKMYYTKDEKECYFYCRKFEQMFYENKEKPDICAYYQERSNNNDTNLHVNDAARQDPKTRDNGIHQESRHPQMDSSEGDRVKGIQTLAGEDIHFRIL